MEKKQYNNIDLFKFIFAIIVVMIHTSPLKDISEKASWYFNETVANLAVPFFFVTSGFLLFGKLKNCSSDGRDAAVKHYLVHIVRMYLVWCVIWIPWKALHYYNLGSFTIIDFAEYIKNIIFVSGGDALWYLPALATAVGIIYLLQYKWNVPKVAILMVSLALYVIGYVISSWYGIFADNMLVAGYYNIFHSVDNGIFCGMIFVMIGVIVSESEKEHTITSNAVAFLVFFFLMVIERVIIHKAGLSGGEGCNILFLPVTVFFLFQLILSIPIEGNYTTFRKLRDYSTLIYLSHCFIIRSVKLLAGIVGVTIPNIVLFMITLALSLAFAAMVRYMGVNKKYSWVKGIY